MKQFFSQYRKCLRFYSSFLQIFSILFLIISMTLGIFFVYVFRQENHNLQQAAEHSYLNILESTSTTLELTMQNLQQIMLDTIWTSDFTNALVVPFDDTYDRTRNILEHLQQLVDVYPFIRSAFLYCPTSQMVYSSDLTYQPVEEASNELFQNPEHLLSYSGARLSKSHTSFFIKQLAGKTIICQHLYPDYLDSLGALIIELDLASFPLSSIFNPESSSRLPCFITDTNGLPIFRGELPSSLASLFPLAALSSVPAQTVLYAQNGLTYFYHRSSSTSWSYILQISTSQLQFYTPLSQIILFCILGLVCSVLLSVLIASKANQPIRRLLFEAGPSSRSPDVDAENEVDYLSKTYSYTTRQNEELSQAIQGITPLVLERLFGHLLSGRPLSEEDISSILSGIGNPFPQEATFLAMALTISSSSPSSLTPLECNLLLSKIQEQLHQLLSPPSSSYLVPQEFSSAAIVLVFPCDISETSIQLMVQASIKEISQRLSIPPYHLDLSCGNLYHHLSDLQYSYLEAQKAQSRRRFYQDEDIEDSSDLFPSHNRYFESVQKILLAIQAGDPISAYEQLMQNMNTLSRCNPDIQEQRRQYRSFFRTLFELADTLRMGDREELLQQEQVILELLESTSFPPKEGPLINAVYDLLHNIERKDRTRASQHIARVQEYILENYSDSTLSLESVAERIGITSSYLSRLFKKETGSSFVDYVNTVRVQKAKFLLAQSELKIKDIAYQTGFHSIQNFFRIFKRMTGDPPGEYRIKQKDVS